MRADCTDQEIWASPTADHMQGLFITGTDTSVGKTQVASAIVRACRERGLRVGAYKPVCTGSLANADAQPVWEDVSRLAAALGEGPADIGDLTNRICPQCFDAPLAPPASAAAEGRTVDDRRLAGGIDAWRDHADLLIVEGVGGLLCPLTETTTVAALAAALEFPLVIVAALRLGCINHTLLTLEVARSRGLPIAGVLLNQVCDDDGSSASSIAELTARITAPLLGVLPFQEDDELRAPELIRRIDWLQLSLTAPLN